MLFIIVLLPLMVSSLPELPSESMLDSTLQSPNLELRSEADLALERATRVDPISLAAVGRVAKIGELYDARTDQFLRISLVNGNFSTMIQSTHNRHSNIKYLKVNTLSEKLNSLDVQAGFKLSVLFGLVQVSGSGKYIRDTQHSSKSVKVSVANFMTTEFEQIDIAGVDGRRLIDLDILAKIDATHVVVGIQWGGNVIISVEDYNSENRDKETVVGSLAGKLEMAVASISVDGSVAIDDEQRKELSQFNFELYGDILPEQVPITVVEAIVLMKNVPKMLMEGNDGKGKILSYSLLPIALFRELLSLETEINSLVAFLDESTINSCVKLFEELSNVELKINDLKKEINIFRNYISKDKIDKINALDNSFQLYQYDLKRRLAEHLILVRSGKQNVNKITKVLEEAYSHELSPNLIDYDQFIPIQAGIKFVELLTELSAHVLEKTTTFNQFMSMNMNKNIYSFFYSEEFPHISDEAMIAFRQFLGMGVAFDPIGIFVAINADVIGDMERQTYFNFNAPNILRLYNNGVLVIDNYTLSSNTNPTNVPEVWSLSYMQTQLSKLINNPVPMYYVYVQYPDMPSPETLWPLNKWLEITQRYAGLFFRAEGGTSECFTCPAQEDASPRIVRLVSDYASTQGFNRTIEYRDGQYEHLWMDLAGSTGSWRSLKVYTLHKEVRPRNKAIRIWERSP